MNNRIASFNVIKRLRTEEESFFISEISKAIKEVQHLAATTLSGICVSSEDWQFQRLTERLDHMFLYGLKNYIKGYFEVFREFTHQSICDEISHLRNITTGIGRSRAWLLHALRNHLLGSYLQCAQTSSRYLARFYDTQSLFFDEQKLEILITLLSGLENIKFVLHLDVDYLDLHCFSRISFNSSNGDENPPVLAMDSSSNCDQVFFESDVSTSACTANDSMSYEAHKDRKCPESHVIVEHLPRKKKKNRKNLHRDDSSISSDSTNILTIETSFYPSQMDNFDGQTGCSLPEGIPDTEAEVNAKNEVTSNKSAKLSHFDELFEKIVFGKTASAMSCITNNTNSQVTPIENKLPCQYLYQANLDEVVHGHSENTQGRFRDENLEMKLLYEAKLKVESSGESIDLEPKKLNVGRAIVQDDCQDVESLNGLVLHDDDGDGSNYKDSSHDNECRLVRDTKIVESNYIIEGQPTNDGHQNSESSMTYEFNVSNNLKVILLLDIFKDEDETFIKAFQAFQNFMEGRSIPLLVVFASQSIYFLIPYNRRLKLHYYIPYTNLRLLSIGLNEQSLDFVMKNKSRYSICTCNPQLTRCLVNDVSKIVSEMSLSNIIILQDATNQKISIKRWISDIYPDQKGNSTTIKGFFLVSYDSFVPQERADDEKVIKKGSLHVLTQVQHMHGVATMWRKGFFVLKKETLHEFEDRSLKMEVSTFQLSEWQDCKSCGRSISERKHCFSLVPLSNLSLQKSTQEIDFSEKEQKTKSPISQLLQSVSSYLPLKSNVSHCKALPALTFSAKTKEDAGDWIMKLQSVIARCQGNKCDGGIKTGCCIIRLDTIHLVLMNSITCHIQSLESFPISDLQYMTHSGNLISLSFNSRDANTKGSRIPHFHRNKRHSSSASLEGFELVELADSDFSDQDNKSSNTALSCKSVKKGDCCNQKLAMFFESQEELQRFNSEVKLIFSQLTGTDLRVPGTVDTLTSKVSNTRIYCDWNSMDGVIVGIT